MIDDKFTYYLEAIRLGIQEKIMAIGEVGVSLKQRKDSALKNKKSGIFISLGECDLITNYVTNIQVGLLKDYDILIHSSKHDKLQKIMLEALLEAKFNLIIIDELKKNKSK